MAYITGDDLRGYIGLRANVADTAALDTAAAVACEWVDEHCGPLRQFPLDDAASTRTYRTHGRRVWTLDFATAEALVVATGPTPATVAPVDATLVVARPYDAAADGVAYDSVELVAGSFDEWVTVTARWGWPAIPERVRRAALLTGHWLYRRKDSPFGTEGFDGYALRVAGGGDPDARRLLAPLRRVVAIA